MMLILPEVFAAQRIQLIVSEPGVAKPYDGLIY